MSILEKVWARGKEFLGVKYPIMCGAMTWVSDINLAKAVSENGAFPTLAGGNMDPDLFEKEVDKFISTLKTPFAVNLITIAPNFRKQYEIVQSKNVPFVIFAGNFPKIHDVQGMKKAGKRCMAFASTDQISEQMIRFGCDALILEGSEAGGHIGYVSTMILLQQILFKTKEVPVFVAGGIGTGKMIAHMLLMGAAGVQLGTRFVVSEECNVHPNFKQAFIKARARHAIATPQYDQKLHVVAVRALKNKAMEQFGKLQLELLKKMEAGEITHEQAQFEVEKFWIGGLRKAAVEGDIDYGSVMAGQSVGLVKKIQPMKEIIEELVNDAEQELQSIKSYLCNL
ncbi:MAG: NAD(P)H-dependent flavin oxidoreductase [Brevinematia bacterium]